MSFHPPFTVGIWIVNDLQHLLQTPAFLVLGLETVPFPRELFANDFFEPGYSEDNRNRRFVLFHFLIDLFDRIIGLAGLAFEMLAQQIIPLLGVRTFRESVKDFAESTEQCRLSVLCDAWFEVQLFQMFPQFLLGRFTVLGHCLLYTFEQVVKPYHLCRYAHGFVNFI